jgi:hypothetical protein
LTIKDSTDQKQSTSESQTQTEVKLLNYLHNAKARSQWKRRPLEEIIQLAVTGFRKL